MNDVEKRSDAMSARHEVIKRVIERDFPEWVQLCRDCKYENNKDAFVAIHSEGFADDEKDLFHKAMIYATEIIGVPVIIVSNKTEHKNESILSE